MAAAAALAIHGLAGAQPASVAGFARLGGASSVYLFSTYTRGSGSLIAGLVVDPRAGYRETIIGAGASRYSPSGSGWSGYITATHATDSWYATAYLMPAANLGRLSASAFSGFYLPVERTGVAQVFVDPVTAGWRLHPRLDLGWSWSFYDAGGWPAEHGTGPTIRVLLPGVTVVADYLAAVSHFQSEWRLTLQVAP